MRLRIVRENNVYYRMLFDLLYIFHMEMKCVRSNLKLFDFIVVEYNNVIFLLPKLCANATKKQMRF